MSYSLPGKLDGRLRELYGRLVQGLWGAPVPLWPTSSFNSLQGVQSRKGDAH
jgi:hypothetical protein